MVMVSHFCLMAPMQSIHGPSSYGQVDSIDGESHGSRGRARIHQTCREKVWHHVHAFRGLPFRDVTNRQLRKNGCQNIHWTCNDKALGASPSVCWVT